jgi:hypothetical protein
MLRSLRTAEFNYPNIDEVLSKTWEIFIPIIDHNTEKMNQIIDLLERKTVWTYAWYEFDLRDSSYNLYEYIILPYPKTEDWFFRNLSKGGMYENTNQNPNNYRLQSMQKIVNPRRNYQTFVRIDKGPYKGGKL